jgi:outer membrane lipoprotein-sorting protein
MAHIVPLAAAAWLTLSIVGAAQEQTPEERGLVIATEADARASGWQDSTAEMEMTLVARNGDETVRRLRGSSLEVDGDGDRSLVVFDSPRDISGTAVLTYAHPDEADDQWLFLPALKRVKRIAAANQSGAFMGSELAYEDLVGDELGKFTYRWLRDAPCPAKAADLDCYVIERRPRTDTSGYRRHVVWLDATEYRPWKIDYYDRRDELLKTLTYSAYERHLDRFWRAHDMVMVNYQTGRETRLRWVEIELDTGLSDADFSPAALRRAR